MTTLALRTAGRPRSTLFAAPGRRPARVVFPALHQDWRRLVRRLLVPLALGLAAAAAVQAQAWPSKPVTLLVPFPPGGSTDVIARAVGPKLQQQLGGTFIVD